VVSRWHAKLGESWSIDRQAGELSDWYGSAISLTLPVEVPDAR